jgi:hypothetical protein
VENVRIIKRYAAPATPRAVRTYEFGCRPPLSGAVAMLDVLRRMHDCWNAIVEVDRAYHARQRALLPPKPYAEDVARAREAYAAAQQAVRDYRRLRRTGAPTERLVELQQEARRRRLALEEWRRRSRAEVDVWRAQVNERRDALAALHRKRSEAVRQVLRRFGLWWAHAEDLLGRYEIARDRAWRAGRDLRFHSWRGEGRLVIRYRTGLPVPQAFEADTSCQIAPIPETAWTSPVRAERRRLARTVLRLRIGSDGRAPRWLVLPIVLHRPLPADGIIRQVAVVRRQLGDAYRYSATVVVATAPVAPRASGRACAVSPSWHVDVIAGTLRDRVWYGDRWLEPGVAILGAKSGLRVATVVWDDGRVWRCVLPQSDLDEWARVDEKRSQRDRDLEVLRRLVPAVGRVRSADRLARRLPHDEALRQDAHAWALLQAWVRHDDHHRQYAVHARAQLLLRRRESYRRFAAAVAREARVVLLPSVDWALLGRRPSAEVAGAGARPEDRYRVLAAPSTFVGILENAVERLGGAIRRLPAAGIASTCAVCGGPVEIAQDRLWQVCACGAEWDRHENACRVLLARAAEPPVREMVAAGV